MFWYRIWVLLLFVTIIGLSMCPFNLFCHLAHVFITFISPKSFQDTDPFLFDNNTIGNMHNVDRHFHSQRQIAKEYKLICFTARFAILINEYKSVILSLQTDQIRGSIIATTTTTIETTEIDYVETNHNLFE